MDLKSNQLTSEDADFSCYICRASHLKNESGLYQHLRDKHGKTIIYMYLPSQPREQYTCEICFNDFNTLPELTKHRHTKHWKCQDCGRLFLTKMGLTIVSNHTSATIPL
jgi:DNA-directed RNA polymerase subunit RPC12/RpoP